MVLFKESADEFRVGEVQFLRVPIPRGSQSGVHNYGRGCVDSLWHSFDGEYIYIESSRILDAMARMNHTYGSAVILLHVDFSERL